MLNSQKKGENTTVRKSPLSTFHEKGRGGTRRTEKRAPSEKPLQKGGEIEIPRKKVPFNGLLGEGEGLPEGGHAAVRGGLWGRETSVVRDD